MTDYIIECHRSAREEILFRIKHKDWYLKFQLFTQATLLAISGGVKLGGVESTSPIPLALSLAVPISFIFACLYYRENKIIGHISRYLATIEPEDINSVVSNWDSSNEHQTYRKGKVTLLLMVELTTFFLIPTGLFVVWVSPTIPMWLQSLTIIGEIFLLLALLWIVLMSFNYLRGTPT